MAGRCNQPWAAQEANVTQASKHVPTHPFIPPRPRWLPPLPPATETTLAAAGSAPQVPFTEMASRKHARATVMADAPTLSRGGLARVAVRTGARMVKRVGAAVRARPDRQMWRLAKATVIRRCAAWKRESSRLKRQNEPWRIHLRQLYTNDGQGAMAMIASMEARWSAPNWAVTSTAIRME
ncbi:hypothetical protein THASP1DRAFT_25500 [Thamnocephalis sphaerospora]|uniref:Uncharacterized protein n=1 Tax=Thamnocephalis sphaerospora TaxID=78915 RepID=A0A4P9XK43_9FUNG|nr:hypothetical protein THASP1DRAFT_25500 [Thamnocephalis sphaerospora]|eukprot:RKP06122.1 hypothetical protein THASP1DRAFT_25500 [Thamnocephalis sphaerospora]